MTSKTSSVLYAGTGSALGLILAAGAAFADESAVAASAGESAAFDVYKDAGEITVTCPA